MPHFSSIDKLRAEITDLPGWEAQMRMSPVGESSNKYQESNPDSKKAGVIALLFPDESEMLNLIYIKRTSLHKGDKHSGQISFPGGQREDGDENLEQTALRELEEELGIPTSAVHIIGALTPLYIWVSNFYVEPYLAYMSSKPEFIPQASEVEYPIVVPMEALLKEETKGKKDLQIRNATMPQVPYYDIYGDVLWGATAMMTSEITALFYRIHNA